MSQPDGIDERRRRLLKAAAASGVGVTLAGCQSQTGDSTETTTGGGGESTETTTEEQFEPQGPGDEQYISGETSQPAGDSLNPLAVSDGPTVDRMSLMYDPAGVLIDGLEFEGRLLEDFQVGDDNQSATYVVRDGLEWGAGYGQVTADDYIAFVRDIALAGPEQNTAAVGYSQTSSYILGGEPIELEKLGKLEFRANLPQSRGFWKVEDPISGAYIVPQGLIEKYKPLQKREVDGSTLNVVQQIGQDEAVLNGELNGNLGPFNYEEWNKGQKFEVSINEDYYLSGTELDGLGEAGPNLDSYTYQVFDEASTGYSALRAGDITSMGIEGRKVEEVTSAENVKRWETEFGEGTVFLALNHRINGWEPIRQSAEVRQAFAHVIDKSTLIDQILAGFGQPIATFHERWGPFYPDEVPTFEPSLEMARQKFMSGTSGEYGYDSQDRFIGPDGEQVELRFALVSGNQTGEIIANYLTQRLEQIGITTDIVSQNFGNVLGNFLRNSPDNNPGFEGEPSYQAVGPYNNGAFDESISAEPWDILYGIRFTGNPFSPWGTIKALLGTQAQFNFMGYTPEIDIPAEVDKAATASSEDETRSVMSDLFEFLARDQPLVWLYNNTPVAGYREPVTGLPEPDSFWDRPDARTIGLSTTQ